MKLPLVLILVSVFVSSISLSYAEEIIPKYPIMKNFPYDSQKGVVYYLERYYSESVYKTWFHENFSGTIEEAVGLMQSYSHIQENIDDCLPKARADANEYARKNVEMFNADVYSMTVFENSLLSCTNNSGIRDVNDAGVILAGMSLHEEAIVLYDKAIELHNPYAIATANKATSLFELGEVEESEKMFDRAVMLDPQNDDIKKLSDIIENKIDQKQKNAIQTKSTGIICGTGTIYKDGQCIVDHSTSKSLFSKGGGCLIATATYGSELAPQVQQLRELRDNSLLQTESGTSFMNVFNDFYYSFSPVIADYERENPVFREMVKIAITPMISSLSILNYVDMNSEAEVLGYGISLILLNVGMYFGIPTIVIVGIRKIKLEKALE